MQGQARRGMARRGVVGWGEPRQGPAWRGGARRGMEAEQRHVKARRGAVRRGKVGLGEARRGEDLLRHDRRTLSGDLAQYLCRLLDQEREAGVLRSRTASQPELLEALREDSLDKLIHLTENRNGVPLWITFAVHLALFWRRVTICWLKNRSHYWVYAQHRRPYCWDCFKGFWRRHRTD